MSDDTHFLNPKPTQEMYELPVGYLDGAGLLHDTVTVREMTGIEEEILVGNGLLDDRLNRLISNCVVDLGGAVGTPDMIRSLTTADRLFLLIAVRRVSLGGRYSLLVNCPACSKEFRSEIDLADLSMAALDDPSKRSYDGTLPSGLGYSWHVLTGNDEKWQASASKMLKGEGDVTVSLLARLDTLGGESLNKRLNDRRELKRLVLSVARLGMRDRIALRNEFSRVEGVSDTKMEFVCDCGNEFCTDFALDPKSFFFPSEI